MITIRAPLVLALSLALPGCASFVEEVLRQSVESENVACTSEELVVQASGEPVALRAWALPRGHGGLSYAWYPSAGEIDGEGDEVLWDLRGAQPGKHEALVAARDTAGRLGMCSLGVTLVPGFPMMLPDLGLALVGDEAEDSGFDRYTYLLFRRPPSPEVRPRFASAASFFVRLRRVMMRAREADGVVMYLPVDTRPPSETALRDTSWIFEHYNYGRAGDVLGRLRPAGNDGPYLVISPVPLSRADSAVVNDMSTVPPHLIEPWIKHSLFMVADEGSRLRRMRLTAVLRMRLVLGILAEGFSDVQNSVEDLIRFVPTDAIED